MKVLKAASGLAITIASLLGHGIAQERPKISSVSHLSVYAEDMGKTDQFYTHDLGATKGADPQNPAGVRYYFSPLQFVEILPLPTDAGKNRLDHVGYSTANADAMRRYLATQGITVPAEVTSGSDGSKYFEVKDPEGIRVQFLQPPAHPVAVPDNNLSTHIIHVGYIVHDPDVVGAFYLKTLGFRPYWHGGGKEDSHDWTSMQVPDGTDWVELMMVHGPEKTGIPETMTQANAGVLDHFSLGVVNMEKTVNMLFNEGRLNAKASAPKIGRDAKWQINLYDPDGTRAEVMEFQPVGKPCCSPFLAASPTK